MRTSFSLIVSAVVALAPIPPVAPTLVRMSVARPQSRSQPRPVAVPRRQERADIAHPEIDPEADGKSATQVMQLSLSPAVAKDVK